MNNFTLFADRLFDGQNFLDNVRLTIFDGVIDALEVNVAIEQGDEHAQGLVVPGFIDLQVNGGGGALLNSTPSLSGIKTIMAAHSMYGTTAMLPTLITDTIETMALAADAIAQAIAEQSAGIVGVHFEGPHLSVAKKGAHSEEHIRPISEAEWQILSRKDIGQVLVTLAR